MVYNSSQNLPQDMFLQLSYSLEPKDILTTSQVSTIWNANSNNPDVWEYQSRSKWPNYVKIEGLTWKDHFKSNYNGSFGTVSWHDSYVIITRNDIINASKIGSKTDSAELINTHTGSINQLYIFEAPRFETKYFTCASDGYLNVWQSLSEPFIHREKIHDRSVNCMEVAGTLLFTGSSDSSIKAWRINVTVVNKVNSFSFKLLKQLKGHTDDVICFQISKERKDVFFLFSGSRDCSISVWSINENQYTLNQKLIGHQSAVTALKLHNRSNCLISGSVDKTIRIWKKLPGNKYQCTQIIQNQKTTITSLITHQFDSIFFSASLDGSIQTYKYQDGKWLHLFTNNNPTFKIVSLKNKRSSALKIDNTKCCTLLSDGKIILWEITPKFELKPNELITYYFT